MLPVMKFSILVSNVWTAKTLLSRIFYSFLRKLHYPSRVVSLDTESQKQTERKSKSSKEYPSKRTLTPRSSSRKRSIRGTSRNAGKSEQIADDCLFSVVSRPADDEKLCSTEGNDNRRPLAARGIEQSRAGRLVSVYHPLTSSEPVYDRAVN